MTFVVDRNSFKFRYRSWTRAEYVLVPLSIKHAEHIFVLRATWLLLAFCKKKASILFFYKICSDGLSYGSVHCPSMSEMVLCPWPSVSSILLQDCAVTAGTEAECTRFRWICYWQQTQWYQASFLPLHRFTRTTPHYLGCQHFTVTSWFYTFLRGKRWWLSRHIKPLQLVPTIADDVKLQHIENVFCMDKVIC